MPREGADFLEHGYLKRIGGFLQGSLVVTKIWKRVVSPTLCRYSFNTKLHTKCDVWIVVPSCSAAGSLVAVASEAMLRLRI